MIAMMIATTAIQVLSDAAAEVVVEAVLEGVLELAAAVVADEPIFCTEK